VRARWRVQRLDWVPSVLAGLDRPFVIEEPGELRERVRALAEQLATYADARFKRHVSAVSAMFSTVGAGTSRFA